MPRWSPIRILSAGLVLLVTLLAVQQWRWIRQIEIDDHYRGDRRVGNASVVFKGFFDHELETLIRWTAAPRDAGAGGARELAERVRRWRAGSRWPGLVQEVHVVLPPAAGERPRLARLDVEAGTLEAVDWPARLEPVATRLAGPGAPSRLPGDPPSETLIFPGLPAILRLAPAADGPHTLVVLDQAYFTGVLIPDLVALAFPSLTFDAIDVTVAETETGRVVYSTLAATRASDLGPADAVTGLLRVGARPAELEPVADLLRPGASGPRRGVTYVIPGSIPDPTAADEAWFEDHWAWFGYTGHWRLFVHSPAGPAIEQAASGRNRHLAMAFGLLAMLAATVGLVVGVNRRAQREARRELDRLAVVSHELRTPLTVLASAGDNLADGLAGGAERVRRYGRLIRGQTHRLEELVENVLHLARRRSRAPRPAARRVEVGALVQDALEAAAPGLEEAAFTMEVEIPRRPLEVAGNPRELRSAVGNLISNAVKHAREGAWLRVTVQRQGSDRVRISVEDGGPGLDPDDLGRLSEPYVRGDGARADGSGIGLAVVQDVVASHRGRLTVEPSEKGGARMVLTLPLVDRQ